MKVSVDEALRRGLLVPVYDALIHALQEGEPPWRDLMRLADAGLDQPDLLRRLRQQVTSLRPQDSRAWRVAVLCDRHLHNWSAAVESIRRCYALGDYDDQLRITEANLLEMLGDAEAAGAALEHPWPDALLTKVWALRARVWLRVGDHKRIADELGGWLKTQAAQGGAGSGCLLEITGAGAGSA